MKNFGVIALISGWVLMSGWGAYIGFIEVKFLIYKISVILIWLGITVLLLKAIFDRIQESRNDPYKDIER